MALFPRQPVRNQRPLRQFYKKHLVAISISCTLVVLFVFATIIVLSILNVLHVSNINVWVTVFLSIGLPLVGVATPLVQWLYSLYMEERRASMNKKLPKAEHLPSTMSPEPSSTQKAKKKALRVDWGEAPQISQFCGRGRELLELEQWIVTDKCQFISILGIGGIGKTALTVKIMERVLGNFEYALWCELKNAPPLENVLKRCLLFLSNHQYVEIPEDNDEKIAQLYQYLQTHRCLLVLDNMETILQSGSQTGELRSGYEAYSRLITRIALQKHQSCVIVTSREKPSIIAQLDGTTSLIRSLQLLGLAQQEALVILKDKGLKGTEEEWKILINRYSGNPLALRLVSQFINEVFNGDISGFLLDGNIVFTDIEDILGQQFQRLSPLEQEVMYWLAIERQAIPPNKILEYTIRPITRRTLQEAWRSLRRRHLIEPVNDGFTLQNVIMEYMTESIVTRATEEIITGTFALFEHHALMQAQVKDYIRTSQSHVILKPIIEQLLLMLGKDTLEQHLRNILANLRKAQLMQKSYIAGNVINLLIQHKSNLRGYDFSHLVVRQAYLRGISLVDVNFA